MQLDKTKVPLKVSCVETLKASQFLVDNFQLRVEELGLLGVCRQPFQLLYDLLSQAHVLIMNGVQILVNSLDVHEIKTCYSDDF